MKKHARRVAQSTMVRFGVIGVINTLIDFTLLNILTQAIGLALIPANVLSASAAMTFSFLANRNIAFRSKRNDTRRQATLFVLVTVTSVYVIQNVVIFGLTEVWTWPLDTAYDIIGLLDREVFINNAAKMGAIAFSLVWNFVFYKKLVFNDERSE